MKPESRDGAVPYRWREFRDRGQMAGSVAAAMGTGLARILLESPVAGFVATGGTTAPPILEQISGLALDWSRIWITLSDERWVPLSHEASNEAMVRRTLLRDGVTAAHFLPLYSGEESPEAAEARCNQELGVMPWSASLCLLGMGSDGHVASLFPGAPVLDRALDPGCERWCMAVRPPGPAIAGPPSSPPPLTTRGGRLRRGPSSSPRKRGSSELDIVRLADSHPRMTLTLRTLTATRHIHLVIAGADKRAALLRAVAGEDVQEMPVRAILNQAHVPVSVYWAP